jgi:DNA-binding response OmpR family regulator
VKPASTGGDRSTFTLHLPLTRIDAEARDESSRHILMNGSVLVVEDEPDLLQVIQWGLEAEGMLVDTAADGQAALDHMAQYRPALVLLDMGLPIVDGYGVAAGLRDLHGDSVPIIVVTADGQAAEKARRVGAVSYVRKPFDLDHLLNAVQRGLEGQNTRLSN